MRLMKELIPFNIYHLIKNSSEKKLLYYFSKAYQDAYDNQSVIFSSEETIKIDFTKSSLYFKKFILKFAEKNKGCFICGLYTMRTDLILSLISLTIIFKMKKLKMI